MKFDDDAIVIYHEHKCPEEGTCPKCEKKRSRQRQKEIKALIGYSRVGRNNV